MATSYHSQATTTGADIARALASTLGQANGVIKTTQEFPTPPSGPAGRHIQTSPKKKYRHVAALHSKTQSSCLSHESEVAPSFLGFRNLMVLVLSEHLPRQTYVDVLMLINLFSRHEPPSSH